MTKIVIKRDGSRAVNDPAKIVHWAKWADVVGANWLKIANKVYENSPAECTTKEINQLLIKACIDEADEASLMMAGRILMGDIHKEAFGGHKQIPTVKQMYYKMVNAGLWDNMCYSDEELDLAETIINHKRDLKCIHSVVHQNNTKYAIRDMITNKVLESPAFIWMRMALGVSQNEPKETRMKMVKDYYDDFQLGRINPPTPNTKYLGTPKRNYASCCVVKATDSGVSMAIADFISNIMTQASAGIGYYPEARGIGDGIKNNTLKHGGKRSYFKSHAGSVAANVQGSRGGASTTFIDCLDPEIMSLLRFRHPTTASENKVDELDYAFRFHPLLAEYALKNKEWMLVSFKYGPELYQAMTSKDPEEFGRQYLAYENSDKPRKYISARKLVLEFLRMAEETGRMYECNTLAMNYHTPFKDPIFSSNLCLEIGLPTKEYINIIDLYQSNHTETSGEIGLCNLAAIVAGRVSLEDYEEVAYRALKMVDTVIDLMDYPFPHLKHTAQARRSAAIGISNLAHDLASKGLTYTSAEGKAYMHRLAETHSFYLHKASVRLARERGACEWFHKTRYADGWLPIDTYAKEVDNITNQPLIQDWEALRADIKKYGMRNSVLEGYMPVETSSQGSGPVGTVNSLYPIRDSIVMKTSGNNKNIFLVPDWELLKDQYQFAWDVPTRDLTQMYAIFQKFTGQGISADYYRSFKNGKAKVISAKEMFDDWLYRIICGLKTKYYNNSAVSFSSDIKTVAETTSCESCKM